MSKPVRELHGLEPQHIDDAVLASTEPVLLRGLVAQWPATQAARRSDTAVSDYLRGFYRGEPVVAFFGSPSIDGRFFYNEDLSGFNFRPERLPLNTVFDHLASYAAQAQPSALYVGSTDVDHCLPGFRQQNDLNLGSRSALASIWIGNRSRIAAHHDLPDNLACVIAGRRRFTLFPPSEIGNLYIGPLDLTPAGQAISLVDFTQPDLQRFPRFEQAMQQAQIAELEAGDALFIPSLWWHHVEGLDPFNVLLNYWWRRSPAYMDTPMNALMLAIMSVRDLPAHERRAWQGLFEHYVFAADDSTAEHIPAAARRVLAPLDAAATRELRARLLKRLNR